MTPTIANDRFGRYQLIRPLAQGGMAEIFLARQSGPAGFEKQVVIKRVLPDLATDREFVNMFLDEARLAARLSHPNIVQTFDFGEADGSFFLAMEYLVGEDLGTIQAALQSHRRAFPSHVAAIVVASACEALHYAHTCLDDSGTPLRIVHRDISPSNIFITYQGVVKVLDFGIAKAAGKLVRTEGGVLKGKFLYMSPEQVGGRELDARSDVFALGAVLHELLSGRPVFERSNAMASIKAIGEAPILPPSAMVDGVPAELEAIAMRALERDLAKRWQSALEMRLALDSYIAKNSHGPVMSRLQEFLRGLVGEERIREKLAAPAPAPPGTDGAGPTAPRQKSPVVRGMTSGTSLPRAGAVLPAACDPDSEAVTQQGAAEARPADLNRPRSAEPRPASQESDDELLALAALNRRTRSRRAAAAVAIALAAVGFGWAAVGRMRSDRGVAELIPPATELSVAEAGSITDRESPPGSPGRAEQAPEKRSAVALREPSPAPSAAEPGRSQSDRAALVGRRPIEGRTRTGPAPASQDAALSLEASGAARAEPGAADAPRPPESPAKAEEQGPERPQGQGRADEDPRSGRSASPARDPCGGLASLSGAYCGTSTQSGFNANRSAEPNRVYYCSAGVAVSSTACPNGCYVASAGRPDGCIVDDPCAAVPSSRRGTYCGSSMQNGFKRASADPSTLYLCEGGRSRSAIRCANGCFVAPPGREDGCQ